MLSADLSIGTHVAYDRNEARSYHSFSEAYVFAVRPRGTRHNYWGANHNHDTIGVVYHSPYMKDENGSPLWQFVWTRPQNLHMTWDEYQETIARADLNNRLHQERAAAAQADRTIRWNALPAGVRNAITDWRSDTIIERGSTNMQVSLELIETIVAAARASTPAVIAAEVEAALALLG